MSFTIIGTVIAVAINLCLAVWALLKAAGRPAYRVFAFFAISVVFWTLGYEVYLHHGLAGIWHRLSFIGLLLAPANLVCLALTARTFKPEGEPGSQAAGEPARRPAAEYWQFLLYAPVVATGVALNPSTVAGSPLSSPTWHIGSYALSTGDAQILGAVMTVYLAAALWISWRAARAAPEGGDWPFRLVEVPFVVGTLCVLGVSFLRGEKSPTVSLWAVLMSEYAIFAMIRNGFVHFEMNRTRNVTLALSAVVLGACVALGIEVFGVLFGRTPSVEMSLVLVVSIVALCVLYAAMLPRLEENIRPPFPPPGLIE